MRAERHLSNKIRQLWQQRELNKMQKKWAVINVFVFYTFACKARKN